jgi:dTDP-D-glucose 4,6-dehydratase
LNKYVFLFPDIDFINVDCLTYAGKLEHLSDEVKSASNYFFEKVDIRDLE